MNVKLYQMVSGFALLVEEIVENDKIYWNCPMCVNFAPGRDRPVLNIIPFPVPMMTKQTKFEVNTSLVLFEMELEERMKNIYESEVEKLKAVNSGIVLQQNNKLIVPGN